MKISKQANLAGKKIAEILSSRISIQEFVHLTVVIKMAMDGADALQFDYIKPDKFSMKIVDNDQEEC